MACAMRAFEWTYNAACHGHKYINMNELANCSTGINYSVYMSMTVLYQLENGLEYVRN